MRVSVITPSFRPGSWLRLCIASVADQGVDVEHIVQDAGSDDGTLDWLRTDARVRVFVEKDAGMYDAINRGLRRATGEILAWLNCDEQYLPGALAAVLERFEREPALDVLFGDIVFVDAQGRYAGHRKVQTPLLCHTWTCHLSTLSCAMFFRRRVIVEYGEWLDPRWRTSGDGEWMVRLLRRRVRMAALGCFTSAFTLTGVNMSRGENARREERALHRSAPLWMQWGKPLWIAHHRLRRWLGGMYRQPPFSFAIYTPASPARRETQHVTRPRFRWRM
ncbi:MAG: glycosyltransferase [Verrucomicrobiae bacterium]|nr:glycosyltransferase [Verrucomicrobiae bacterium]